MFDENSNVWIRIYKGVAIFSFCLLTLTGIIIGGISTAESEIPFISFILYTLGGAFFGFVQLVCNMLIINLLNNVQVIRESIEHNPKNNKNTSNAPSKKQPTINAKKPEPKPLDYICPYCEGELHREYVKSVSGHLTCPYCDEELFLDCK
ncbi:MAG: hypothetical protein IJP17_01575 [Clostridia bacterium]|nr:hypothetical protein [Clostridia bacterium]